MPYDQKLQFIAKRTEQPLAHVVAIWVCLLDAASQHDPRGVLSLDLEEMAVLQDIDQGAVERIIQAFRDKGMITEDNVLASWAKRQRTTSTERSREHRSKKKQQETGSNGAQPAASSAQRKNQPDSTRTEKNRSDSEHSRANAETDQNINKTNQNKKQTREKKKGESERKKPQICGQDVLLQMLDIWNEEVQSKLTNSQKAILTEKRKELMSERWLGEFQQDIRAWRYFCEIIGKSDFCLGKIEGKDWTIDLTWAVESSDHVAKILEGGFSGGKHPSKPPMCNVPELQEAWDFVLYRLQQKHGQASIRSWFSGTEVTGIRRDAAGAVVVLQCPRPFVKEWITRHFLSDLNCALADQPHFQSPIITTELIIKEAKS